jgi:hypothetical protein
MSKLSKLKKEHIQRVNKELDEMTNEKYAVQKEYKFYPSENVRGKSQEFIKKMGRL